VENAVLLGAPVSIRQERWRLAGASVSGRFINGYSRNDWVLGIVYRGGSGTLLCCLMLTCDVYSIRQKPITSRFIDGHSRNNWVLGIIYCGGSDSPS